MGRRAKPNLPPGGGHWLLPELHRVVVALGLPGELAGLVARAPSMAEAKGLKPMLPLDPKTLRKGVMGMSARSRWILWMWVRPVVGGWLPAHWLKAIRVLVAAPTGTLAWRSLLRGVQLGSEGMEGWSKFPRTQAYLLERCHREDALVAEVTSINDRQRAAHAWRRGLLAESGIPETMLGSGLDGLVRLAYLVREQPTELPVLDPETARTLLWLYFDPWLQLAAVAETEWRTKTPDAPLAEIPVREGGTIGQLWPQWSREEARLRLPSERLFELLRRRISEQRRLEEPMSWHRFAEHLPEPRRSSRPASEASDPANKYRQLRQWMKDRRPSDEGFGALLKNLDVPDGETRSWRFLLGVAYGLDATIRDALNSVDPWPVDPKPILGELFDRYPDALDSALCPRAPNRTAMREAPAPET
jgi:hypothetical protein